MFFEDESAAETLRKQAEQRMIREQQQRELSAKNRLVQHQRRRLYGSLNDETNTLTTADAAKMAEIEYRVNGDRAIRSMTNEFVGPRWDLDDEVRACRRCFSEFDWLNRRHHCRFCGKIFCGNCANKFMLLPVEFRFQDPQRVCEQCAVLLLPQQLMLVSENANHNRLDIIDVDDLCMRNCNLPFSTTMESEIRKASYSILNLVSQGCIDDRSLPMDLLKQARGIAFLTILKCGFIFCPKFGTGLVVKKLTGNRYGLLPPKHYSAIRCTKH